MGAIRRKFMDNFTMIHNDYLNDNRLGSSEIGWLTYMLSRPDNWNFSIEGLAHTHTDGKTKIVNSLNKLKELGYFRRIKLIDEATGRIVDWIYEFSDEVQPEWIGAGEACEYITPSPQSDFPDVDNQPQSIKDKINTDDTDHLNEDDETNVLEEDYQKLNDSVKVQINYDAFCEEYGKYEADRIKDIIIDVHMRKYPTIRMGGNNVVETATVKEAFERITYTHIMSNRSIQMKT